MKSTTIVSSHAFLAVSLLANNPSVKIGAFITYIISTIYHITEFSYRYSNKTKKTIFVIDICLNYLLATGFLLYVLSRNKRAGLSMIVMALVIVSLFWSKINKSEIKPYLHGLIHISVAVMIYYTDKFLS